MLNSDTNKGHPRFAELDGLRALAVLAVILFHCEISGVFNAGFFGVDIFFTISGFIITAILLKEYRKDGDFRFLNFYFRRLKRLLPPVLVLIMVAIAVTEKISPSALATLVNDLPAALFYGSNWWQIHDSQDYFDTTPHVLKHLWSLAVEEQFYIVWPPVAYVLLKKFGTRTMGWVALAIALLSTAWMACLYQINIDGADQNRVYLGTDTHAMGLLAGAALACFWNPWAPQAAGQARVPRFVWRALALAALAALGYLVQAMNTAAPAMYRGLFLVVPALSCVVIYVTMRDRSFFVSAILRDPLAQWIGLRSYSLYLVHWPVFVWMRLLGHTDFSNWMVLAAALGIVALASELLYRAVEAPSMVFDIKNPGAFPKALAISAYAIIAGLFSLAALTQTGPDATLMAAQTGPARPAAPMQTAVADLPAPALQVAADAEIGPGTPISGGEDIYAIADSVMLGAKHHLSKAIPGIRVDAAVGRQASQGLKVVRQWRGNGGTASTVLVHLGTNGYIDEGQFRELLRDLSDRKTVIVINVRAERRWTAPNNAIIGRVVQEFPNVRLIDWNALSARRPEFFVKDGIHLTQKGIFALTAQIKLATGGSVIVPDGNKNVLAAAAAQAPAVHAVAYIRSADAGAKAAPSDKPAGPAAASANAAPVEKSETGERVEEPASAPAQADGADAE